MGRSQRLFKLSRHAGRFAVAALAAASVACHLLLALANPHVGFLADDALYLLMADAYSPWRAASGPVVEHLWRYAHLPPFYPLLLGLAGAGADQLVPARIVTSLAMSAAWLLCFLWLRRGGVARAAALLLAAFGAWTPVTLLYTVDLWSEGLYVALVLVCLIGLQASTRARPSLVLLFGIGVAAGCAFGTRSIGIALLPAAGVALAGHGRRALLAFAAGFAFVACALWPLDMGQAAPSYTGILRAHYAADPLAALAAQLEAVAARWPAAALYDLFQWRDAAGWRAWAGGALALAMACGLLRELARGAPAAVYTVVYMLIAWTWPYPEQTDRLLWPLLPCALWFAWRGVEWRRGGSPWFGTTMALLLCAFAAPALHATLSRALTPLPDPRVDDFRTTRYWLDASRGGEPLPPIRARAAQARAARDVARHVPVDGCIYTFNVQQVLLLAQRPSFLPPRPTLMERGPPWGCAYFLLVAAPQRALPPLYPLDDLRPVAKALAVHRLDERDPRSPIAAILVRVAAEPPR